ncbi:MAG: VCBS repeat-containing protein, partial [Planctomycetales bacterium]|nr:VCBS repeat-containing protein [Planctomycetales bacterium]
NNGARNVLFRNDGDWNFKNVTKQVGLEQNNSRFSLACSWEDFDNDGDQDLYVANDFGRNNFYRNDDGKFTDVAVAFGVEDMSAGMSVAWGDYNNDGRADLYVSNMWSSAGNRISFQRQFLPADSKNSARSGFQRHARGNSLFRNDGDRFVDASEQAHVTRGGWAWTSSFADINNDGWEDLLVANGYVTQHDERDL